MDVHPLFGLAAWIVFIILTGFLGSGITAIEEINLITLKKLEEEGDKRAAKISLIKSHHRTFVTSTDLFSILLVGASIHVFFASIFPWFSQITDKMTFAGSEVVAIILDIVFCTFGLGIYELLAYKIPRKVAYRHSEKTALKRAGFICFLMNLSKPLQIPLDALASGFLRMFHIRNTETEDKVTEEEIMSIVTEGHELGVLESDEAEMISNIFELNDQEAKDVMTHRKNIVAVDASMNVEEAFEFMLNENYSRFPVYEEDIDNIIGIIHLKDVAAYFLTSKESKCDLSKVSIAKLIREPYFVPDTQNLDVLFHDMQAKKMHMAIAIDEYGQTAGLIAMEDIIEEIVGDIQDEYDEEETQIVLQEDGTYLVNGSMMLNDLEDELDVSFEDTDCDTVNGLMISLLDHIPFDDEQATVYFNNLQFDIVETRNKMITLAKVTKCEPVEEEEPEDEDEEEL